MIRSMRNKILFMMSYTPCFPGVSLPFFLLNASSNSRHSPNLLSRSSALFGVLILLFLRLFRHDVFDLRPEAFDLSELVADLSPV